MYSILHVESGRYLAGNENGEYTNLTRDKRRFASKELAQKVAASYRALGDLDGKPVSKLAIRKG